jgi:hypothetical protein
VWQPDANDDTALQCGADTGKRSPLSQYIYKDRNVAMCCIVPTLLNVNSDTRNIR